MCLFLVWWAVDRAGGFGTMMHAFAVRRRRGQGRAILGVFWPSLTAMVGFWATLALNIPDFTRFARSQKDRVLGQAIGLPCPWACSP